MTNNVEHLFHVLICHLFFSFSEQFKSFAHFFLLCCLFSYHWILRILYIHIQDSRPLLYILFVITSSQSMACFSILWIALSMSRSFKFFIRPNLSVYSFMNHDFGILGFPSSSADKESSCNAADPSLFPEPGRSLGEGIGPLQCSLASLVVQKICLQSRRPEFNPWVRKIPWRREQVPPPVFCPGEFHGQRSLAGTVHGVAENPTWLSDCHTFTFFGILSKKSLTSSWLQRFFSYVFF